MTKREEEIYEAFEGKLIGHPQMQMYVCRTLAKMPKNIIKHITQKCWFLGSMVDAWSFAFKGDDLKGQFLIFLSDELFLKYDDLIYYSIAHEIGHVMLNHRNSTFIKQGKKEIEKQEKEADEFAKKYTK